ncbi:MAG: PAS domain S-box protein [Acetobacteraceae bacterium]|nr:MAG: PAS domain S-box protein [Acetobacteraceae bacterium]
MTEPPAAPQAASGEAVIGEEGLAQLMLDSMRHGIALFDSEGRLVIANRLASRIAGLDPGMLRRGEHIATLIHAQAANGEFGQGEDAAAIVSRALALDRRRPSSLTRRRPDGTVVEVASTPAPGGGFVVTFSDVTAHAEAEAALRDQAEMLHATLDNLRHGILVFGPDARLRLANALTADLSGLPPAALQLGRSHAELVSDLLASAEFASPEDRATALQALGTERSQSSSYTRTRPDGRIIEVRSDPTPDGGFIITHVEVTRQAQAEAAARRQAAQMQAMQDHMRHGIAYYGPDRRLITMNRLAGRLSGVPKHYPLFGALFEDVVDSQAGDGVFGAGAAAAAEVARIKALDRRQPIRYQRTNPAGEVTSITSPAGLVRW